MHLYAVNVYNQIYIFIGFLYKNLTKIKKFAKNYCIIILNVIQCEHHKFKTKKGNEQNEKDYFTYSLLSALLYLRA